MSITPPPFVGRLPANASSVVLAGEIDLESVDQVQQLIDQAIETSERTITVDMGAVTYLGSTGLHVLLTACEQLQQEERSLVITRASPQVQRLLDICGLTAQLMSDVANGRYPAAM